MAARPPRRTRGFRMAWGHPSRSSLGPGLSGMWLERQSVIWGCPRRAPHHLSQHLLPTRAVLLDLAAGAVTSSEGWWGPGWAGWGFIRVRRPPDPRGETEVPPPPSPLGSCAALTDAAPPTCLPATRLSHKLLHAQSLPDPVPRPRGPETRRTENRALSPLMARRPP